MNKELADNFISQYQNKIFGFAMEKMRNITQAEELASDIVCEVYLAFLRADEITNLDGYVYRIARNVHARYIRRLTHERDFADISDVLLPYHEHGFERLEQQETTCLLRKEIAFLSERQRTIIYLHYYQKKSVAEIARLLGISSGTVKWHLSDARSALKEEIIMDKHTDNLTVNPIRFVTMGHNGNPGSTGDTSDMFNTQLKQNIAWCCYHTPHTIEEIARALSVPSVYIQDEIRALEEYGYLDRLDKHANSRFRTNMLLYDMRLDHSWENVLYREAAEKLCTDYYEKVFADFESDPAHWGFTCPDNDINFMKHNLVLLCSCYMLDGLMLEQYKVENRDRLWEKYAVERPDGGKFIAHATVSDTAHCPNTTTENKASTIQDSYSKYGACGYMSRWGGTPTDCKLFSMQIDCRYSVRAGGWRDNLNSDWQSLYEYLAAGSNVDTLAPEDYKRLCDKGYLVNDALQVMMFSTNAADQEDALRNIILTHAPLPNELLSYCTEFDKRFFEQDAKGFPEHILPIIRFHDIGKIQSCTMIPRLVELMLERGMLKPLTDIQKKVVFTTIVYNPDVS